MKEYVSLNQSVYPEIMKNLGLKKLKCSACGKSLNKRNFGFIAKDIYACNNTICVSEAITEFEEGESDVECECNPELVLEIANDVTHIKGWIPYIFFLGGLFGLLVANIF